MTGLLSGRFGCLENILFKRLERVFLNGMKMIKLRLSPSWRMTTCHMNRKIIFKILNLIIGISQIIVKIEIGDIDKTLSL